MPALDFHRGFFPLTAHPFDREDCREVPPCKALRPYVRCFWGPVARKYGLVVPDACADIIILPEGQGIRMHFCPVDNTPYISHSEMRDMFAVRFYFELFCQGWFLTFSKKVSLCIHPDRF